MNLLGIRDALLNALSAQQARSTVEIPADELRTMVAELQSRRLLELQQNRRGARRHRDAVRYG